MGYDMRIVEPATAEEAERLTAALQAFWYAVKARDSLPRGSADRDRAQQVVDMASRALDAADVNYFRLNISGMGRYCDIMSSFRNDYFGMLKDCDPGPFPVKPDDLTWDDVNATHPEYGAEDYADHLAAMTPETLARAKEHRAAIEAHLRAHDADTPGMAIHKLYGSNDGWLVTPGEIKAALKVYDETPDDKRDAILAEHGLVDDKLAYWQSWIAFLRRAANHGGFRVR